MIADDQPTTQTRYLCLGHPAWPGNLDMPTPEMAQAWLDEHSEKHPGVYVDVVTSTRRPFAPRSAADAERDDWSLRDLIEDALALQRAGYRPMPEEQREVLRRAQAGAAEAVLHVLDVHVLPLLAQRDRQDG